jgi:hypothetical protein
VEQRREPLVEVASPEEEKSLGEPAEGPLPGDEELPVEQIGLIGGSLQLELAFYLPDYSNPIYLAGRQAYLLSNPEARKPGKLSLNSGKLSSCMKARCHPNSIGLN